jgi:hypothetical protein
MKTKLTFILSLAFLIFTGCESTSNIGGALGSVISAPGKILDSGAKALTQVTTNVTEAAVATTHNVVTATEKVSTDPVTLVTTTNVVTVTNAVTTTNIVFTTNLVAVPREQIAAGVDGAKTVSAWLPPNISGPLDVGLAALSGLLTLAVQRRNKMLAATVSGVETATKLPTITADSVKSAIGDASKLAGVADDLHAVVKKVTG